MMTLKMINTVVISMMMIFELRQIKARAELASKSYQRSGDDCSDDDSDDWAKAKARVIRM